MNVSDSGYTFIYLPSLCSTSSRRRSLHGQNAFFRSFSGVGGTATLYSLSSPLTLVGDWVGSPIGIEMVEMVIGLDVSSTEERILGACVEGMGVSVVVGDIVFFRSISS